MLHIVILTNADAATRKHSAHRELVVCAVLSALEDHDRGELRSGR